MSTTSERFIINATRLKQLTLIQEERYIMGKGTFLATVALLIAIAGAIVAFAAYFKRRSCTLCDDFDDDMMDDDMSDLDYYATPVSEDSDEPLESEPEAAAQTAEVSEPAVEEDPQEEKPEAF